MLVTALAIYPVKSLGPVALQSAEVEPRGLAGDRRWMIVDAADRFVTRRELPALARIALSIEPDGSYRLRAPEGEACLPARLTDGALAEVTVWRDTVPALVVDTDASRLISQVAGRRLRLAYMAPSVRRDIDRAYGRPGDIVSFADAFPILVTSETSLAALNHVLAAPVPMARFRPNIVLSGAEAPWAEAGWRELASGPVRLRLAKPCARCIVITQQPDSGERLEGNAVPLALRRLGQFNAEGALFGMNAIPLVGGRIAVGDAVEPSLS